MNHRVLLIFLFLSVALVASGTDPSAPAVGPVDTATIASVRAELEAMLASDQQHRKEAIEIERTKGKDAPELAAVWEEQQRADTRNIARLEEIIAQFGWPGRTQFGQNAALAAFLILQHSPLAYQQKYLPRAREAAAKGEMPASSLALLEDRVRLREGGKQIYGSQVQRNAADEWEPLPLEDEPGVDAKRKSVGLGPIADYLAGFAERSGGRVSSRWSTHHDTQATNSHAEEGARSR